MNVVNIVIPGGISVSGVAYDGEHYYACNGFDKKVYVFESDGNMIGCENTLRAYRSLRYDTLSGGFIALAAGCGRNVYFLSEHFTETGSICPLSGGSGSINYVGIAVDGAFLDITYDKVIYRCNRSGGYVSTVNISSGETTFVAYDEYAEGAMLAYNDGRDVFISSDTCSFQLPSCSSFKSFLPFADKMYAAVGYQYIYTYIFDITEGSDTQPSALCSGIFGYNTGKGCCKI